MTMKKETGSLFDQSGKKISLSDLLNDIPKNNWSWFLFEFNGIGTAPDNLSMSEFEDLVLKNDNGYHFTWSQLQSFAHSLSDINDCLLAAISHTDQISYSDIDRGDISKCNIIIKIFDSSFWEKIYGNL